LSHPGIIVKAILLSDGSLTPTAGVNKVSSLLHELNYEHIPVAIGTTTGKPNPPWSRFNSEISWGTETISPAPVGDAVKLLSGILADTNGKTTLLCLGPLTNIGQLVKEYPARLKNIERVIWYNESARLTGGFNNGRDTGNARLVFNSGVKIDVISNLHYETALFDSSLRAAAGRYETPVAVILNRVFSQDSVLARFKKNHFRLADDLAALYLVNPELFSINVNPDKMNVRYNVDYDVGGIKEAYSDIIAGNYASGENIVFRKFPSQREFFSYDIRPVIDTLIYLYGPDEWKAAVITDEIHGHLGVFSVVGVKMGIKAREIFGVGNDMMEVTSRAGTKPPYSCLNDGIQVSTGSTLGMGTIHIATGNVAVPSAVFTCRGRSVEISLKKEYLARVDADINEGIVKFGLLDDGYWKLIRRNAIRCWVEWDRNKIFDISEISKEAR
jgi:pyrimidine-specific ribonucleoside hydrolase